MSSEEWLDQVGQEYLAQVEAEEPQFLIEIDVPDARLKDIFANIGRARPHHWSPQKRICLALAAVHSAAQADESEDSFREMFYKRLGRHFNLTEWDSEYGPVISEFLGAWFSVDVPTSGPYRYVGTVYRHAGIPVPARSGFCLLVVGLLQDGLAFTRNQYDDAVQRVPSLDIQRGTRSFPFVPSVAVRGSPNRITSRSQQTPLSTEGLLPSTNIGTRCHGKAVGHSVRPSRRKRERVPNRQRSRVLRYTGG